MLCSQKLQYKKCLNKIFENFILKLVAVQKKIDVTSFSSIPYCRIFENILIFKRNKDTQSRY